MMAILQRVSHGSVEVEDRIIGEIEEGLVILLGVFDNDSAEDSDFLASKSINLRIFDDDKGNMNLSLLDIGGSVLAISQFTLCANSRKGRRPSFAHAMEPNMAEKLYDVFCEKIESYGVEVKRGLFGANMSVGIQNNGPVTIILNSRETRRGNLKEE